MKRIFRFIMLLYNCKVGEAIKFCLITTTIFSLFVAQLVIPIAIIINICGYGVKAAILYTFVFIINIGGDLIICAYWDDIVEKWKESGK